MAVAKREKINKILIFLFLTAFPFGRLFSFDTQIFGFRASFLILDLIAFLSFLFCLFLDRRFLFKGKISLFLFPLLFSFFVSLAIFKSSAVLVGLFYLLRLVFYASFGLLVYWFVQKNRRRREFLLKALTLSLFSFLVFGFWQYVFYYDLTSLKFLGWDDHQWRLTSTLLDPGFAGILFSFGFVFSLVIFFFIDLKKSWLVAALLFVLGTALSFSRASYLALVVGSIYFFYKTNKSLAKFLVLFFLLLIVIIPKPAGEGVNLLRLYSVFDRIGNYKESLLIFSKSPVFGVGYNNFCLARKVFLKDENLLSHSCSGSDSSFLFVLSTLGVVGFLFFLDMISYIWKETKSSYWAICLKTLLIMILIHSQFNNSIFYPWVLGVFAFVLPIAVSAKNQQ